MAAAAAVRAVARAVGADEESSSSETSGPPAELQRARDTLRREGVYVSLSHLDLATYLFAKGIWIERAVKVTKFKFSFTFYDPKGWAEAAALNYVNGVCDVSPAEFADAQRRLKSVIHRFDGRDDTPNGKSSNGTQRSGHTRR